MSKEFGVTADSVDLNQLLTKYVQEATVCLNHSRVCSTGYRATQTKPSQLESALTHNKWSNEMNILTLILAYIGTLAVSLSAIAAVFILFILNVK